MWPIYITIGNIDSEIRNKPSKHTWIPLAFLPIPPKRLEKLPDYPLEKQELDALQVFHEIVSLILSPLTDDKTLQGIPMACCDEKVRKCVPKLAGWLADHIENCTIHGIANNQCPMCIAPTDDFGHLPDTPFPPRPHAIYAAAYRRSDAISLRQAGVKNINNALWHLRNFKPYQIVKPDTLHTLYLGMLEHLMKWVFEFLTLVGRANTFHHLWSRLPPFSCLARSSKAYRSVSQWQGKEMRNLLCVLLAGSPPTLSRTCTLQPLPTRHTSLMPKAILYVRYMMDFMQMAQYKIHTPGSIQSMIDYLADFYKNKTVFLRFRAIKAIKSALRVATYHL